MKPAIHILSAAAALLCCALALPTAAQEQTPAKASAQPAPAQELAKLTSENQLADQKLKKKLQQINAEKEELGPSTNWARSRRRKPPSWKPS